MGLESLCGSQVRTTVHPLSEANEGRARGVSASEIILLGWLIEGIVNSS